MKTFLINLARSKERLALMDRRLKALGVAYERIEAVDGKSLSRGQIASSYAGFRSWCACGCRMPRGVLGCALSHLAVYQKIVKEQLPCALILEDDLIIDSQLKDAITRIEAFVEPSRRQIILLSDLMNEARPGRVGIFPTALALCTDGYVITFAAAKEILWQNMPVIVPADGWGRWHMRGDVELYKSFPPVVRQDIENIRSEINGWIGKQKSPSRYKKLLRLPYRVPGRFMDWLLWKLTGK